MAKGDAVVVCEYGEKDRRRGSPLMMAPSAVGISDLEEEDERER